MAKPRRHDRSKKGVPFRRVIKTRVRNGREEQYHATKGWRSYRKAGA